MLNFDSCKQCLVQYAGDQMIEELTKWPVAFKGYIRCPPKLVKSEGAPFDRLNDSNMTNICDLPPVWCPFKLEHILKENADA